LARQAAIAASQGSPGIALEFLDQDLGGAYQLMQQILQAGDTDFLLRGALSETVGARPDRDRMQAVAELARAVVAGDLARAPRDRQARIIHAHAELVRLAGQLPTYNFDPALAVMEIGGLLAHAAMPREAA
jgi:DNA polymerase-3 subunit delta'